MQEYSFSTKKQDFHVEDAVDFLQAVEGDFTPPLLLGRDARECYEKWYQHANVVMCREKGQLVALCCFYSNDEEGKRAYIPFIAVAKAHRGNGIASAMLEQVSRQACHDGMTSIGIHTNRESTCQLYVRNGYVIRSATPKPEEGYTRYYLEKPLSPRPLNILLTSAGRRSYLVHYFKEALEGKGLVHASNSVMTYTLTQADKHVITPGIYDEHYIDFLLTYCQRESIAAIIPLFDIDLPVLAQNAERFAAAGVRLILSSERVTAICNDKWKTYHFLKDIGLKQPLTFLSLHEATAALQRSEMSFPLFIKPRWGMGSLGIYQAETEEELRVLYNKVRRDIFKTYLRFESHEDEDACVLIQEKIKGEEFGLDVLNDLSGRYVTTIAKKKIAMRAGETDVAEIVDNTPFIPIGRALSDNLSHCANLDVDCFCTGSGDIYVLELNCRFGGQYPFSHNAGVDFPRQIISWLEGGESDPRYFTPHVGTMSVKELTPVVFVAP